MKLPKNRQSGQALVMALILLALGSLLVVPLLGQSFTNLGYHQSIECKTVNSYTADSGVEYALCKLYNRPGAYTDALVQWDFTLNNRSVSVTANYTGGGIYKVTSVASGGGCGSTRITTYINLSAGAFAFVVAAEESMTINNATVNATDPGEANIHSNWDITLSNCEVDGHASAVDSIAGEGCANTATWPSPPIVFPGDYSELYRTMAQEGDNYTDYTLQGGDFENPVTFGPAYIEGDLTIGPDAFIKLIGTIYVTGEIHVKPHTYLEGEENMLAERYISIEGGEYRSERIPVLICTGTGEEYGKAIYCTGGIINAVVYAPNGHVKITGKTHLYGAVGGNTVEIINATITYAAELAGREDLPGGELHTIAYSYS